MKKKLLFVFNPKSGKGLIKEHLVNIVDIMTKAGYKITIYPTQCQGDAIKKVRKNAEKYDLVVCSGGDGTLDEVVTGIMKSVRRRPIGYIPAGSTNDFAQSLNIPKNMAEAAKIAVSGKMFACEHEGVLPDLMCMSKGITGGYLPLGATMVTDEIYNVFLGEPEEYKTFYHGHSYTGNPLACAAGLAGLEIFAKDKVIAGLPPKMAVIEKYMEKFGKMPYVGNARQCGMLAGVELMRDKENKVPFGPALLIAGGICQNARKYGLIVRNIGDVIIFMPPLASTAEQIEEMLGMLEKSMAEVFEKIAGGSKVDFSDPCAF